MIVGIRKLFYPDLLDDFYEVNDLWGGELMLYNINEESLKVMKKITTTFVEQAGVEPKIEAITDKIEVL